MSQISLFERSAIDPVIPAVEGDRSSSSFMPRSAGKKMKPFAFQSKMIRDIYDLIRANCKRILAVAAPSAGKTYITTQIVYDATQRASTPLRVAFVVEMDVLAQQTLEVYQAAGLNATLYQGGEKYDPNAPVVVISSQTLEKRVKDGGKVTELLGNFGLILGDEIHALSQRESWRLLNEAYTPRSTIFLGLTGTPWNEGDRSLYHWFDKMVCAPQPPDLVKIGRLVIVRGFPPDGELFDSTALKWSAKDGDFDMAAMQDAAIENVKLQMVLREYKLHGEGRRAIAYCSGILHAKLLCRVFVEANIPAEVQIGDTKKKERKAQHARLMSGETLVLFSIGTCTKGYDAPFVSCIMLVRAIGNKNLYHQMSCRGNRAYVYEDGTIKTDCLLLDLGGNIKRFGHYPTDHQDYSVALMPPKRKQDVSDDFYKTCPECKHEKISMFAKFCPKCGFEFGKKDNDQETLFDVTAFQLKEYFTPLGNQQIQLLRSRKHSCFHANQNPENATNEFMSEFGFPPPLDWHLWAVFGRRASKSDRERYLVYLQPFAPHDYWLQRMMRLEFGGEVKVPKFLANWKDQWWEILGLHETCKDLAIAKKMYLELAKQWHPDVCKDQVNAELQMKLLNYSWEEAKKKCK